MAIKGEATAIEFYKRLAKAAPDKEQKEDVLHALEDEKKHFEAFTQLYIQLTGIKPEYSIEKVMFNSYKEGLERAYKMELEAYEEYRDSYLLTRDQTIRDVFFLAMTDEIEHAMRFGHNLLKI
ncbi:ferritin-like domain-containing protein [Pseudalkalibacillus caeni]|uniref:Ferritin-like domain-containing protein n=2 Tax=Exobacillus caeni TaxID=2574798 RepID=A0A5R9F7Q5_9BACL|nr:ferritin-like domain-containing protein [Pseudalkalibacillus caeni]